MNAKFGTDGIRGIYGKTLNEADAYALGAALGEEGKILIGRDNRPSSPLLARALACGAASVGGKTDAVGVITTPALYRLLSVSDCAHAVMVTASHNPPEHNGLKVFTREGKPNEETRRKIESKMSTVIPVSSAAFPYREKGDLSPYVNHIKACFGNLGDIRLVLDCAGGAGSVFKGLYREMGADVTLLNARENGDKINENCGALHPEQCARETLGQNADLGIAIDGDGDRIVLVTRKGEILDGDRITYLLACRMKRRKTLRKDSVAMTVMTNSGIAASLKERGIDVISTPVGDAALAETMKREGLNLGGEQSGHVILGDYLPTGDGLLVGAAIMRSILEDGPLEKEAPPRIYPQILLNVPVLDRSVAKDPAILLVKQEIEASLPEGRVLLRSSGTESLVRIMVEAPDADRAEKAAEKLKAAILRR